MTDWLPALLDRCARSPRDYEWLDIGRGRWLGWRFPVVYITRELLEDAPWVARMNPWHRKVSVDFDRDLEIWAWWLYAPLFRVAFWWRWSAARFCVERAMRGRIADKPEGSRWTEWNWKFRAPRRWTLRATRPQIPATPRRSTNATPRASAT